MFPIHVCFSPPKTGSPLSRIQQIPLTVFFHPPKSRRKKASAGLTCSDLLHVAMLLPLSSSPLPSTRRPCVVRTDEAEALVVVPGLDGAALRHGSHAEVSACDPADRARSPAQGATLSERSGSTSSSGRWCRGRGGQLRTAWSWRCFSLKTCLLVRFKLK